MLQTAWLQVGSPVLVYCTSSNKLLTGRKLRNIRDLQAGPGRAGSGKETKIFDLSKIWKSMTDCYVAWFSWKKRMGMFAVLSGCLQPLQLRLPEFTPRLCFQDPLCWYVCLGRHFFPKWKLKFCRIIMAIGGDICSKIQAWNSQRLGLRADWDVSSRRNH